MADESTQTEVIETVSPTTQAETTDTQAGSEVVAAGQDDAESVQKEGDGFSSDEDKAYAQWKAKQGGTAPVTSTPVEADETAGKEDTKPQPVATTPSLTPEESAIVKRYGLEPADIPAMSADARSRFLRNIDQRAKHHDALMQSVQRNQPAQQPPVQGQQQTQTTGPDDPWESVAGFYGEEGTTPIRTAFERSMERAVAPAMQFNQQLAARMVNDDIERSIEKLELPEGIDKTNPEIRQKLIDAAKGFFGANGESFDLVSNNFTHAMPKAAASLFLKEMSAAQVKAKADRARKALMGSPSRGSQIPTTRSPQTEEDREKLWFAEQRQKQTA